ncbi:alkaline phosphatase D family protein [Viridibacterium curvum]|uniref:Alkaline phosphatase D family protein n=1 Tax=Viridibacterium curvum TaxID=1101404 RepID=A0ABP9QAA3_9RHOO
MNRRDLLKLAAFSALAQSLPRSAFGLTLPGNAIGNLFSLGVASGSPRHDSVVIWTRLMADETGALGSKPIPVSWEVADDEQFRRIVQKGSTHAHAELGHSVHVEVPELAPDRWYFYRFRSGQYTSRVGRTRTLPAPGAAVTGMRLAYASCQRWEHGYYAAWRHLQAEAVDAVFFVGDYIYEYSRGKNDIRSHDLPKPTDLASYRDRYALYKSDPDLQGAHAACPWLMTWDDHEVINDYAGLSNPVAETDFAARRAAAYQAFYENQPMRARTLTRALTGLADGAEMRIYDRGSFGTLADFHILDCRQYRSPQACLDPDKRGAHTIRRDACSELADPARTFLGMEQERWLADGLKAAGTKPRWTLIVQTTRFGQTLYGSTKNPGVSNDTWDGYPATRQRLINALIQNRSPNPVLLGGDVHANWVGHIKADYNKPDSPSIGVEFTGTSISSNSNGGDNIPNHIKQNPHFVFGDGFKRGYGVVELEPDRLTTTLRAVVDPTRADSGIETLARFEVEAGKALIHPR